MKRILILLCLCSLSYFGFGQLSQGGIPYSLQLKTEYPNENILSSNIPIFNMPVDQSIIKNLKEESDNKGDGYQFAYTFDVNIDLKGIAVQDSLDCGILYRLAIQSPGAYSINIIFSEYYVPPCAKLFMYNETYEHIIGAFTSNNNKEFKKLAVSPVAGEKIILEYFEPYFADFNGSLIIGKISHDFLDILNTLNNRVTDSRETCLVKVNCSPEGDDWQNEKRAVCHIITPVSSGAKLFTGALINNTNNDGKAYVLTGCSSVCAFDSHMMCSGYCHYDTECIFYFNSESSSCGSGSASFSQSISGATLLVGSAITQYALLELSKQPRATFRPYFAGWDRNDAQDAGGVSIHTYDGQKYISTFNIVPQNSDCFSSRYYKINWIATANGHGVCTGYGAPLFNAQKRIIGQHLDGGDCNSSGCKNPDKHISNFGKLFSSWEGDQRLKNFLDPQKTGATVWDGIDACVGISLILEGDISSGSSSYEAIHIESTHVIHNGADVLYLAEKDISLKSGFHAQLGSQFHAKIEDKDCVEVPDGINLMAWTSVACIDEGLKFNLTGATHYTVKIQTITGALVYNGSGNIVGNSVIVWTASGVAAGLYVAYITFSSLDDEISNAYYISVQYCKSSDPVKNPEIYHQITEISNNKFDFTIFPNPNDGNFTIKLIYAEEIKPFSIQIFNALGKLITEIEHCNAHQISVNQTNLPPGVYFVKLSMGNNIATKKIIIE